ncbi:unnamed protein product [Rotaria sp. Silwood1]|nr:unnamed protein product [Rotaria sp. Silwood1]CAF3489016.1 unnamed protein product [Rotaria sp. Silwood1]CAF4737723.1 unnamed protein product [Rotaria sp. Silwood1]
MFQQSSFRGGPMHLGRSIGDSDNYGTYSDDVSGYGDRSTYYSPHDDRRNFHDRDQEQLFSFRTNNGSNTSSFNRNNSWKYSATNSDLPPPTTLPSLIVPQNTVGPCRGNFYNNPNYNEPPTSLSV